MSETTGAKGPIDEFETEVFMALDHYFEARRRELEDRKKRAGTEFKNYEEARRQLMQAELELEHIQRRTAELKGKALNTVVGSSEASELEEGVSELQEELGELAGTEQSAQERKREAEERLQRTTGPDIREHLAEAASALAAVALAKVEEIDAFKERVDKRFAEGRTSVIEVAA
jgi:chromosome segregation ATPase